MDDETCHVTCIEAMFINATIVSSITGWPIQTLADYVTAADSTETAGEGLPPDTLIDCRNSADFEFRGLSAGCNSWQMTSDSMAAIIASKLGTTQLILLKSIPPQESGGLEQLAKSGFVDDLFPRFAKELDFIQFGFPNASDFALSVPYKTESKES